MISVIVPVYNTVNFIDACLTSIINQSYRNIEIIIVDDGSTDGSGKKCDDFAVIDKRIKVFHIINGGVSKARNYALERASGDYIYFCDSDDLLYEDCLETLIKNMNDSIDCSIGGYIITDTTGKAITDNKNYKESYISIEDTLVDFYNPMYKTFNGYIWNRLFKRSIILENNIRFKENIYIKEDGLFLVEYLCKCKKKTFYTTKPVYKYIQHSSSAMHTCLNTVNKKSLSRLEGTIFCYKAIKSSPYKKAESYARSQIVHIARHLFYSRKRGINGISEVLKIEKLIITHTSFCMGIIALYKYLINATKIKNTAC